MVDKQKYTERAKVFLNTQENMALRQTAKAAILDLLGEDGWTDCVLSLGRFLVQIEAGELPEYFVN